MSIDAKVLEEGEVLWDNLGHVYPPAEMIVGAAFSASYRAWEMYCREHFPALIASAREAEASRIRHLAWTDYFGTTQLTHAASAMDTLKDKLQRAEHREQSLAQEVETLRETNARLNRRCQQYEAGLAAKLDSPLAEGRTFGRVLANAAAEMYKNKRDALAQENARLREALKRARSMLGPHSLHPDAEGFAIIDAALAGKK